MVKIINKILNVILIAVIVLLVGYFLLRVTNQIKIYSVKTGSMEDNIHAGDYILILKKSDYKVGDIVTYQENDYFITHRIVKKNGDKIITKGDANNSEDGEINADSVIGKVILVGGFLNFLVNYKYALVGTLLTIYLITYYYEKYEEDKIKK